MKAEPLCVEGVRPVGSVVLLAMEATLVEWSAEGHAAGVAERDAAVAGRVEELSSLSAHLSAATARWLEVVWEMQEQSDSSDLRAFVAWRCGSRVVRHASFYGSRRRCRSCR